jgi:sugar lactone lactonase YvrE
MMDEMFKAGIVFSRSDMERMANTFADAIWNGDLRFIHFSGYLLEVFYPFYINDPSTGGVVNYGWGVMGQYSQRAQQALDVMVRLAGPPTLPADGVVLNNDYYALQVVAADMMMSLVNPPPAVAAPPSVAPPAVPQAPPDSGGKAATATFIAATLAGASLPDGGSAAAAVFSSPGRIRFGADGNLYIADNGSNRVRRIYGNGDIETVLGTGERGFPPSVPGTPPGRATLNGVANATVDESGSLYFLQGNVLYAVTQEQLLTLAGTGGGGYSGEGKAVAATLSNPSDFALRSGEIFIADTGNHRIRKVDRDGIITTIAGTGTAGYSGDGRPATEGKISSPRALAFTPAGDLLIAEGSRVRAVGTDGVIRTLAGTAQSGSGGDGGSPSRATLTAPGDLSLDRAGNIYVADPGDGRIRKISEGSILTVFDASQPPAGSSTPAGAFPHSIAVRQDGDILFAEGNRIRRLAPGGIAEVVAGQWTQVEAVPAAEALLLAPSAIASSRGTAYVADTNNHRIVKIDAAGNLTTVAGDGISGFSGDGGPAARARLAAPFGLALDREGNLLVADTDNARIRRITPEGRIDTVAGNGRVANSVNGPAAASPLNAPRGLAVGADGSVYIAEFGAHKLLRLQPDGSLGAIAGTGTAGFSGDGGAASGAQFNGPQAIALDAAGNLLVADSGNNRVRKIDASGTIRSIAGPGVQAANGECTALFTSGVAVDPTGNVWFSETGGNRVKRLSAGGTCSTVAGTGAFGTSGDGGPATAARFGNPFSLAVTEEGDLIVVTRFANAVRRLVMEK